MKKVCSLFVFFTLCMMLIAYQAQAQLINYNRRSNEVSRPTISKASPSLPIKTSVSQSNSYQAEPQKTSSYYNREAKTEITEATETTSQSLNGALLTSSPKVTSRVEKIYDTDYDGTLQKDEIVEFLGDVVSAVERRGSFAVSSDILKNFDRDADGEISLIETDEIKKYLN
ncbi:MAG: hypothetical protein KC733_10270 [Candidatus Omnitrophica bacterium]|nr:hypothetical protein [Candidatus Omnitrophota bacterium]